MVSTFQLSRSGCVGLPLRYSPVVPLRHFIVRIVTSPTSLHYASSKRFFSSGAIPQSFACGIELGMRRRSAPIHLDTPSGYRCGVGRTAKQSQIIPAYFWLVISITLYIQKQNLKFVKILRFFCRDYRTLRGGYIAARGGKSPQPRCCVLFAILYQPLLFRRSVRASRMWCGCWQAALPNATVPGGFSPHRKGRTHLHQ